MDIRHVTAKLTNNVVLRNLGLYFVVLDKDSPANKPGILDQAWESARKLAAQQGCAKLFCFNQFWIDLAKSGDIQTWLVLFDGVYKIEVDFLPAKPVVEFSLKEKEAFLGKQPCVPELPRPDSGPCLRCPSGELIVSDIGQLGTTGLKPLMCVPPGDYRIGLLENSKEVARHEFLGSVGDYPGIDGPDWVLRIQRDGAPVL